MRYVLLIIALILSFAAVGLAHTVTFQPGSSGKDTWVYELYPDENYGLDEALCWGNIYGSYWTLFPYWTFIEFDDLNSYIYTTVISADLELYVYYVWGEQDNNNWVDQADNYWNEGSITWNNSPGCRGLICDYFERSLISRWLSIDVTNIVADWLSGGFPNFGFVIGIDSFYEGGNACDSGDHYTNPHHHPKLTLEYYGVDVQPTSLGEVKAMFK